MLPQTGDVTPKITVARIWGSFIPFSSYGVFQRGGYFIVDVIPETLAVISLNTIYFYDPNKGEHLSPSTLFFCCTGVIGAEFRPRSSGWLFVLPASYPLAFVPQLVNSKGVPFLFLASNISHSLSLPCPVTDETPLFVDPCIA